jgi:C4-dicarboxylate transporter, DctM subunit
MEPLVIGIIGVVAFVILLLLGVHIGVALATTGLVGLSVLFGFYPALTLTTIGIYHKVANWALITAPLFIMMGLLASGGGIAERIYESLVLWFGKFRSGLGIATTVGCAAFGAVCGSSMVTASLFAKISAPEMRRQGYDKKLAYGICASAGTIGMLIPPSILAVIYALFSGESVGKLLIAGIVPGLLLTIAFSVTIVFLSKVKPHLIGMTKPVQATWKQKASSLRNFWPIVLVAITVFGGIFGGVFSPTEASAVAAFLLALVLLITKARSSFRILSDTLLQTATMSAMIFLIIAGALIFARFLAVSGVSAWVLNTVINLQLDIVPFMILVVLFHIFLGCLLDSVSMVTITVPILTPVVNELGIDPIWYAMVVILAMHVGLITPPVGLNVFGAKAVAEGDVSIEDIFAGVVPFFVSMLVVLAIVIAFPSLSTILPSLM